MADLDTEPDDLEYLLLLPRKRKEIHSSSSTPKHFRKITIGVLLLTFSIGFFVGYDTVFSTSNSQGSRHYFNNVADSISKRSTNELFGELKKHKRSLEKKLISDFDEYYNVIFDNVALKDVFVMSLESRKRLVRRLTIKIASAQSDTDSDTTFIWATGGDSAAAGHGNLFSQAYTNVLEETVKDAFASVDIRFIARNYAMGGNVPSSPEMGLCMESIFGSDIDILTYDFDAVDSSNEERQKRTSLWTNSARLHPTKPFLFMMGTNEQYNDFSKFDPDGMGSALMNRDALMTIKQNLPDVHDPSIVQEILPDALKYYKCLGSIEGEHLCSNGIQSYPCPEESTALCQKHKYETGSYCDDNKHHKSHNPGWKEHFLKGRLLGYFVLEVLSEALVAFDETLHTKLIGKTYQQQILNVFRSLTEEQEAEWETLGENVPFEAQHVGMTYMKEHPFCRTALLPSTSRYDGIMMEYKGGHYDPGLDVTDLPSLSDTTEIPLVFDPADRQQCKALEIDYQDFFYVPNDANKWYSTNIPNTSEMAAYGDSPKKEHFILICPLQQKCSMGQCNPEYTLQQQLNKGGLQILVDGKPVVDAGEFGDCYFLKGQHGFKWTMKGELKSFDFRIRVNPDNEAGSFRFTSVIII